MEIDLATESVGDGLSKSNVGVVGVTGTGELGDVEHEEDSLSSSVLSDWIGVAVLATMARRRARGEGRWNDGMGNASIRS